MKVLAIGDIHTKLGIIEDVRRVISDYDQVVFVGDYADDWNKGSLATIATWESIRELQSEYPDKVFPLIGNHDYIYVNKTSTISSGYNRSTQMILDMPEQRHIKEWLASLPVSYVIDDVTYSHAGFVADWNREEGLWSNDSPIWARPIVPNFSARRQYVPKQVFGHTPQETCTEIEPNVWCIDTFSTYGDGTPIGDFSVLKITNGKKFKRIFLND